MEFWKMENGKATFLCGGKKCLALRQKGTAETGTRMYELVSEKKDSRGLPIKILRELTLGEAKQRSVKTTQYVDVAERKMFKNYYYKASWGNEKFLTEEVNDKEFVESLIEEVKKVGSFKKVCRQTRDDGIDFAGKSYINVEIEYEVEVVEGKVANWKILSENYWRGFRRHVGTKVAGYTESSDGRVDVETTEMVREGSSNEPISDEEKEALREREIWHIEESLPDIADSLTADSLTDIPGLYRPKGEGYKQTMAALIKTLIKIKGGLI